MADQAYAYQVAPMMNVPVGQPVMMGEAMPDDYNPKK